MQEVKWVVVQTGTSKWAVAHQILSDEAQAFLIRFAGLPTEGQAQVIRCKLIRGVKLEDLPEWTQKHLCKWEPAPR